MIHSMTAYAREEVKGEWGTAVWELRSVNQRYLETHFRLPEQFRALEIPLRDRLRKQLQRGKVECSLRFSAGNESNTELNVNEELARAVIRGAEWLQSQGAKASIDPLEVLRWPGVLTSQEADMDALQAELLAGFDKAMSSFLEHRGAEGSNMQKLIEDRLESISQQAAKVRQRMPEIIQWQRDRLLSKFEEAKIELDAERVEQEMVMLAQKVDVAEELDRLDSHIKETRNALNKGGACGRRLDFMMQEFNREANTLGSKSIHADITASAVEIKVLIEQMREQIQNIE
ncbi:YicC/YloC family endoribonuclease [Aliidiomarina quisquiliarum]|uniref:YicC/YloC family endoribonuclease n=1 Tax=Aliidiomarina quisquiliarum TaxID=2938947 RepID=UPI00208EBC1A|nr:YicC/YloC family endoribonuclease [Aliidiomarina quisquiliarum]MCO4322590.1 YicC family protein [Aliidiomarina quisquiliarum]